MFGLITCDILLLLQSDTFAVRTQGCNASSYGLIRHQCMKNSKLFSFYFLQHQQTLLPAEAAHLTCGSPLCTLGHSLPLHTFPPVACPALTGHGAVFPVSGVPCCSCRKHKATPRRSHTTARKVASCQSVPAGED